MEDIYNFAQGDNVLAYFQNLLYEAKCMKRRLTDDGEKQYFIHYKGWKTTWDEWVDEDELLEINEINLGHQQRLKQNFEKSKKELEKIKRGRKKTEKPNEKISLPSPSKPRGRPKKTVIDSEKNKRKHTDKNLQKRGQSEKAVNKPKSNIVDREVKNKIKPVSDDTITEITLSSSTMGNSIETTKNVKTYTNKTKKLTNEVIQNISIIEPSTSMDIDYSNEFQLEYEPVPKRPKTYSKDKTTEEIKMIASNVSDDPTENISIQFARQASISEPAKTLPVKTLATNFFTEPRVPSTLFTNREMDVEKILREQSLRTAAHTYLKIIPFPMRLSEKLPNGVKLPDKLKKVLINDLEIQNQCNKLLKFHDDHYVAKVAYTFIESHNFPDDLHRKSSIILCTKLMNYFNSIVHTHISYQNEIKNGIQLKGMSHFKKRLAEQPNMTYVFKQHIVPKKIWCYVYGPIFLLRFLVRLPFFILKTSWNPECDLDFFVQFIDNMMQFLDDNIDTYFSAVDYMEL
ncbi:uncharacterized protein LOC114132806 [Aphis gossypii]|uniref:Chromo domain-containing protein n=1 Tax=Aphis gossypii TaxID=80765 RepID=A0A9P0NQP1_APHGO|nr:uncharacterized protein LOC114132806 [Aphis gossypii]XP_050061510.1 uncharacterized protein LOC114132806 [Aphis gossypii]CAH1732720.1 unnamed protein product [Aphis gossypii]